MSDYIMFINKKSLLQAN